MDLDCGGAGLYILGGGISLWVAQPIHLAPFFTYFVCLCVVVRIGSQIG
jgi:hypothetical protein